MNIAQRIKDLRLSKHLTQKELAQLLNVKPTTVSGWELGRNEPSIDTLMKSARKSPYFNAGMDRAYRL